MLVKTYCAAMMGLEATTITIEVNMTRGMMFHLSGLADTAVKESYDRIRAAMSNIGVERLDSSTLGSQLYRCTSRQPSHRKHQPRTDVDPLL